MTPVQSKFVELERQKETVKKFFEELQLATEALVAEMGVDKYFQDDQGIVYKTTVPEGKFVHFDKYGYDRTKRAGEARGSLSVKEAEGAGFVVPKQ